MNDFVDCHHLLRLCLCLCVFVHVCRRDIESFLLGQICQLQRQLTEIRFPLPLPSNEILSRERHSTNRIILKCVIYGHMYVASVYAALSRQSFNNESAQ